MGENGLIIKTEQSLIQTEKAGIFEAIKTECIALDSDIDLKEKTDKERLEILVANLKTQSGLEVENTNYLVSSKFITITTKRGFIYTVLYDNTIIEGKFAYLDISDGSIKLKETGYIQGDNPFVEYEGKYIITGSTTENTVSIIEKGNYDITIKDLDIDVSTKGNVNAFLAGNKSIGLNVILRLEGTNRLFSGSVTSLNWSGVTNADGGSTLELCGDGKLDVSCGNSHSAMCIGGNNAKNITITSGEINAVKRGEKYGTPIGGTGACITINRRNYSS